MYYGTADPSKWHKTATSQAVDSRGTNPFRRFLVKYRNICIDTPCVCPILDCTVTAFDAEHARERFEESLDADGWEIVSVERLPRRLQVRS